MLNLELHRDQKTNKVKIIITTSNEIQKDQRLIDETNRLTHTANHRSKLSTSNRVHKEIDHQESTQTKNNNNFQQGLTIFFSKNRRRSRSKGCANHEKPSIETDRSRSASEIGGRVYRYLLGASRPLWVVIRSKPYEKGCLWNCADLYRQIDRIVSVHLTSSNDSRRMGMQTTLNSNCMLKLIWTMEKIIYIYIYS